MIELNSLFTKIITSFADLPYKLLPSIIAIIAFGLVIFIHELGHFVFCKAFNVTVPSFSLGFGPVLLKKTILGTQFQIAAIPLGGYNEIKDESTIDADGKEVPTPDSFRAKPYWQKLIIMLGGIGFNLITAVLFFTAIAMISPTQPSLQALKILKVLSKSPAEAAGLSTTDQIIGIEGVVFQAQEKFTFINFSRILQGRTGKSLRLEILDQELQIKQLTVELGSPQNAQSGPILGVELEPVAKTTLPTAEVRMGFLQALEIGVNSTIMQAIGVLGALKLMFVNRSIEALGGPVMIIAQSFKHAKQGLIPLLFFLAAISVSLAVLNIFPLGALDGGKLLVETFESLAGRQIPALRMMTGFGTLILLGLFVVLTYKDIVRLVFG